MGEYRNNRKEHFDRMGYDRIQIFEYQPKRDGTFG
jgi:hypothetical protein